jgi:hypothetical protein
VMRVHVALYYETSEWPSDAGLSRRRATPPASGASMAE